MQATVDKLTKDIAEEEHKNKVIIKKLKEFGYDDEEEKREGTTVAKDAMMAKLGDALTMQAKMKRDNTEKYKEITDVDGQMVKQLVKLDQELDRLFDI